MYICIYIYMYVYVCMYVYMYICIYVYVCICIYICIYVYICICVYVYMYRYIYIYIGGYSTCPTDVCWGFHCPCWGYYPPTGLGNSSHLVVPIPEHEGSLKAASRTIASIFSRISRHMRLGFFQGFHGTNAEKWRL